MGEKHVDRRMENMRIMDEKRRKKRKILCIEIILIIVLISISFIITK